MVRKVKPPKDSNAPKRPASGYLLYANERRPILQKEHTGERITVLAGRISGEWHKLTAEERKPYEEKAKLLKQEYTVKNEAYKKSDSFKEHQNRLKKFKASQKEEKNSDDDDDNDSDDDSDNDKNKKNKNKGKKGKATRNNKPPKDTNAPKRNQSSYFYYTNERRPILAKQYTNKKITEIAKMIGAEWNSMSENEKKPYEEKAKQAKKEYDEKLKKYKETKEYKQFEERLEEWKKENSNNNNNKKKNNKQKDKKKKKNQKKEESDDDSDNESKSNSDNTSEDDDDDDDDDDEEEEKTKGKKAQEQKKKKTK